MFYQVTVLCWAASAVFSAPTDVVPLEKQQPTVIPIVSQSEELEPNGTYKFSYETGNGIKREEISYDKIIPKVRGSSDASSEDGGSDESDEIHVQQGSYSYTAPDGTVITVRYIADENGFQAFGDHLPRAPAVQQISSSPADKSGRALKTTDSAEAASAPVPADKPKSIPKPVENKPEVAQSAADAQSASSESASAPAVVADNSSEIESRSGTEDVVLPKQGASVETPEQSSTAAASEPVTQAADQSNAATDQTTEAEEASGAGEQSTAAAEQTTTAAEQTNVAAEQSTVAAEQTTAAAELSTITPEQSTTAAEQSTPTEQSTTVAEQSTTAEQSTPAEQSTTAAEQSTAAATEEISSAATEESSSITDSQSTPVTSDSQTSVTAAAEEAPAEAESESPVQPVN